MWEGIEGALQEVGEGAAVTDPELDRQRQILHEAFMAGWQAALAVRVTSPSVRAVIESCFDLWLEEEVDERGVLGLPFRRRYDLPKPKRARVAHARSEPRERATEHSPLPPRHRQETPPAAAVTPPAQRTSPESESYDDASHDTKALHTGS